MYLNGMVILHLFIILKGNKIEVQARSYDLSDVKFW